MNDEQHISIATCETWVNGIGFVGPLWIERTHPIHPAEGVESIRVRSDVPLYMLITRGDVAVVTIENHTASRKVTHVALGDEVDEFLINFEY